MNLEVSEKALLDGNFSKVQATQNFIRRPE
jgi:hypothetical protein